MRYAGVLASSSDVSEPGIRREPTRSVATALSRERLRSSAALQLDPGAHSPNAGGAGGSLTGLTTGGRAPPLDGAGAPGRCGSGDDGRAGDRVGLSGAASLIAAGLPLPLGPPAPAGLPAAGSY
jgi:hypothetical protein